MKTISSDMTSKEVALRDLSVVIPAYNEQDNIRRAVDQILSGLPPDIIQFEIIIVNDGSTDATGEKIRELVSENSRIRGIYHQENMGKGMALRSGFAAARHEWILFTDSDLQIEFKTFIDFAACTKFSDVIIGFRTARQDSSFRLYSSRIYTLLIRLLLGLKLTDINCPFKLFRKKLLEGIDLRSIGFFIDTELMYNFLRKKYRINEVGVVSFARTKGASSVRLRHILEVLAELFALLGRKP